MITVDTPSLEEALNKWRGSIAIKAKVLGLASRDCVEVEAGRLVQTLIKIMPPKDKAALASKIDKQVSEFFATMDSFHAMKAGEHWSASSTKAGRGDVRWYAFQSDAIFGVAEDYDLTNASVDGLWDVYKNTKLNARNRLVAGHRGKQTVYLWQRYVTKAATVKKLGAKIKGHIGRLKAAWLPAYKELGSPKGTYAPPTWVVKHDSGAMGYAKNELSIPDFPSFTMENHALGAGRNSVRSLAREALLIRIGAMAKRIEYLIKYPEKIGEEKA